jgi:tRNA-dihydrouridine synthase A
LGALPDVREPPGQRPRWRDPSARRVRRWHPPALLSTGVHATTAPFSATISSMDNVKSLPIVNRTDCADWRVCIAPMMDWTDRHCRYFHRLLSPHARLYTEMVTSAALVRGGQLRLLEHSTQEHPLALQLGGSDPVQLAQAARMGAQAGYAEINLNVGCPSDRVQSGRFGACLMREPQLVGDCVKAMRDAVAVPVTVKCRIGVDDQDAYADLQHFTEIMLASGVEVLVVHARKAWLQGLSPKENREVPPLDYARVYRLKREFPQLQVIINGGISSVAQIEVHLAHLDGVMLGRAAYHEPFLLARIETALYGTPLPERAEVLRGMRPYVEAELRRGTALKHISRHLLGLYQGEPGARAFRRVLSEGALLPGAGWALLEQALAPRSLAA